MSSLSCSSRRRTLRCSLATENSRCADCLLDSSSWRPVPARRLRHVLGVSVGRLVAGEVAQAQRAVPVENGRGPLQCREAGRASDDSERPKQLLGLLEHLQLAEVVGVLGAQRIKTPEKRSAVTNSAAVRWVTVVARLNSSRSWLANVVLALSRALALVSSARASASCTRSLSASASSDSRSPKPASSRKLRKAFRPASAVRISLRRLSICSATSDDSSSPTPKK